MVLYIVGDCSFLSGFTGHNANFLKIIMQYTMIRIGISSFKFSSLKTLFRDSR